jgi:hypothetical protein
VATIQQRGLDMTPTLTLSQLKALDPCPDALDRVARFLGDVPLTASEARAAGATFDDIAWVLAAVARTDQDVARRHGLWMADCAAHVLHLFERERLIDQRPRRAIEASRAYARGEIGRSAVSAAADAAWDAAGCDATRDAADWDAATWDAARAATAAAAWAATRTADWDAAWDAAWAVAWAAAWAAARDAVDSGTADWDSAKDAEAAWQFDRLIARLSDPEPEDWPLPPMVL